MDWSPWLQCREMVNKLLVPRLRRPNAAPSCRDDSAGGRICAGKLRKTARHLSIRLPALVVGLAALAGILEGRLPVEAVPGVDKLVDVVGVEHPGPEQRRLQVVQESNF